MKYLRIFLLAILIGSVCAASYAAVPRLINYQGRLTNASGVPLEGSQTVTFRIFDAEAGGNLLWQGTYSITVQKGIFNVFLGDISDPNYDFSALAFDIPYFLEIKVGSEVMSPRQRITSAGYALRADKANNALNATSIEVRTSDPASPLTGQMWYRSDLSKLKIFNGSETLFIPPEPVDLVQLPTTIHEYQGGGIGAQSIDGDYNTGQYASYSGGDGGGSCYGVSMHTFNKPRNITMLKFSLTAFSHDDGRYSRNRQADYAISYWTSGATDWTTVPGASSGCSSGGDGDCNVGSGIVNLAVDLRNVTKIKAYVHASSDAAGGEGHFNGHTWIYEIQAFGI